MKNLVHYHFDYLVIGSGLAGLNAAFNAAQHGKVALLSKSSLVESSSYWAQGGIAAAIDPEDSAYAHFDDTITAGRGLCRPAAVETLVGEGIQRVRELIDMGMPFDAGPGGLALGLEGGHSRRRILHAGGNATGQEVVKFLLHRVLTNKNITVFENTIVAELVVADGRCVGVMAFSEDETQPWLFTARATIMSTGGAAGVYLRSTNPPTSTGDGIALAYRAGAEVCDMEFVQFHPTALFTLSGATFLITEAMRGEGGQLLDRNGRRFMLEYDPRAELAPRDLVAASIFKEMQKSGSEFVYLSMAHLDRAYIKKRFANVYAACLEHKIDITTDLIPVAPAAHFWMGGIVTGRMAGSSLYGLFACGECACTGVHGANRLASNSLLECLVFSKRAVDGALTVDKEPPRPDEIRADIPVRDSSPIDPALLTRLRLQLSRSMTDNVGILRNGTDLRKALTEMEKMRHEYSELMDKWAGRPLRKMLRVCTLTVRGALYREESRGAHRREDFPNEDPKFEGHITLKRGQEPRIVKWN